MMGWRSLLFAAADDEKRLAKIVERGMHAVILDLEDAVPPERKAAARMGLAGTVERLSGTGIPLVVRINAPWLDAIEDLKAAVRPGVAAIMIPKVEDDARVATHGQIIAELAARAGLASTPAMIALIESTGALARLDAIASVPNVAGIALGSEDFSVSLGVPPSEDSLDLPCRLIACAAAVRGQMALGLPVSIATIEDEQAWDAGVAKARRIGMTGALCIHPRQIAPVNAGFAPSEAERHAAMKVLAAWENAGGKGAIMVDGKMVDLPVVIAARRTVGALTS